MDGNKQLPLEEKELNTKYLFDLVYHPAETKLVKMARAKNIQVIPGLEMFVQQGARQFEIWAGKPAPVAEMAYVVTKALERQAAAENPVDEQEGTPARASVKVAVKPPAKPPAKTVAKAPAKKAVSKPAKKAAKKK